MTRRGASSAPALFAYRRQTRTGEISFADVLERERLPAWEPEYRFDRVRMWRFDFAWPAWKIAIEIDGGAHGRLIVIERGFERRKGANVAIKPGTRIRAGGRHNSGPGLEADHEKTNAAQLAGWIVLHATTTAVRDGHALAALRQAFAARGLE